MIVCVATGCAAGAMLAWHGFDEPLIGAVLLHGVLTAVMLVWALLRYGRTVLTDAARRGEAVICGIVTLAGFMPAGGRSLPADEMFGLFTCGAMLMDLAGWYAARVLAPLPSLSDLCRLAVKGWVALWLAGTVLLALPASTHPAVPDFAHNFWRHISACSFMSASAASLCGATIYNPGEDLRFFGQAVLYGLMQAAGWTYLVLGLAALRPFMVWPVRMRWIAAAWIGVQVIAVVCSYGQWKQALGDDAPAIWPGLFHAAAAINSCGFTLRQDGLAPYIDVGPVYWSMLGLSLLGGIGLPIAVERTVALAKTFQKKPPVAETRMEKAGKRGRGAAAAPPPRGLDLCSIELHTTIWVMCLAAGALWLLESGNLVPPVLRSNRPVYLEVHQATLADMRPGDLWRAALLMSTNARSAGLHVAPLSEGSITWVTWGLLAGLMLVGGAVGSPAGGMRTGGIALLIGASEARQAGWAEAVAQAGKIALAMVGLAVCAGVFLRLTQPQWGLWDCGFHAASLAGNVGWTTGLIPHLTGLGRWGMIVVMFVGRMISTLGWCAVALRLPATARAAA